MRSESTGIFLACACGAFIGTLLAMSFGVFWWTGLPIGGLIGYLFYHPKEVIITSKNMFRTVFSREHAKTSLITLVALAISTTFLLLFWILDRTIVINQLPNPNLFSISKVIGVVFGFIVNLTILVYLTRHIKDFYKNNNIMEDSGLAIVLWIFIAFTVFLPSVAGLIMIGAIILITTGLMGIIFYVAIKDLIKPTVQAIKQLFVTIHSNYRLLCSVDAALGTLIGYYFHNPIIGALTGGLIGIINYEFLSVRVFKLGKSILPS